MHKKMKTYLTERVTALIREGKTLPWQMPYQKATSPMNPISGTRYRGANLFLLSLLCELKGFSPLFLTFRQSTALQSWPVKGSKSFPIVFSKPIFLDRDGEIVEDEDQAYMVRFVYRFYNVFSIDQLEQNEQVARLRDEYLVQRDEARPIQQADEIIAAYLSREEIPVSKAMIPYYSPAVHAIGMPDISRFRSDPEYYQAFFHEIVHSTGPAMSRPMKGRTDIREYSREELVAEFGAAMLCEHVNVPLNVDNSTAYLQGWLEFLQKRIEHLYSAGSAAERAVDFVLTGNTVRRQVTEAA